MKAEAEIERAVNDAPRVGISGVFREDKYAGTVNELRKYLDDALDYGAKLSEEAYPDERSGGPIGGLQHTTRGKWTYFYTVNSYGDWESWCFTDLPPEMFADYCD